MIKMKISTKVDLSGLKKLQKQLKNASVDVGYINSKDHWMNDGVPVAQIASHLHYWSPWRDQFMLSESKKSQVQGIVNKELKKLGDYSIAQIATCVGEEAKVKIALNIKNVNSPDNSKEWQAVKGFNDPLVFGSDSRIGEEPNLISELTFRVNGVG